MLCTVVRLTRTSLVLATVQTRDDRQIGGAAEVHVMAPTSSWNRLGVTFSLMLDLQLHIPWAECGRNVADLLEVICVSDD